MPREILVFGEKTFRITVPDGARMTFGPWSPPNGKERYSASREQLVGTLRVYENAKANANVLAVFSGVTGYRDADLDYSELVTTEEVSTIWRSDRKGYHRETTAKREEQWVDPADSIADSKLPALSAG